MRQIGRVSLRDLLYILFRDKWRIVVVVMTAFVAACIYLAFEHTIYVAESRVLIRVGKEKLSGIEPYAKDSYNILFQERGQDIHNGIELLRDESLAHAVFDKLRPYLQPEAPPEGGFARLKYEAKKMWASVKEVLYAPIYWFGFKTRFSDEENMVRALRGSLAVEAIEDTDILRVSFGWTDPQFAALALNTFTSEFVAKHIRVHGNATSEQFYIDQIAQKRKSLDEAEAELTIFRTEHNIGNLPLQKELLLKDITELEARLREVTLQHEEYLALLAGVDRALKAGEEWLQTPDFDQRTTLDLSSLDKQYYELVAQRSLLATTYAKDSRELVSVRERIASLREQKGASLITFFRLNSQAIGQQKASLEQKLQALNQRLTEYNQIGLQLAELERQQSVNEQSYLAYRKKAEELRISDELNAQKISGVRVISEARPPVEPSSPRRLLILGIAVLVGLFLGIGYSAISEYFDDTFRGADDVKRILGTELMLTVPKFEPRER